MDRRNVLKGGIVLALANHGTVATAETAQQEPICDLIERLSSELSEALADHSRWKSIPPTGQKGSGFDLLLLKGGGARLQEIAEMRAIDRLAMAAQNFKRTAMRIKPDVTEWLVGCAVDEEIDTGRFTLSGSGPVK